MYFDAHAKAYYSRNNDPQFSQNHFQEFYQVQNIFFPQYIGVIRWYSFFTADIIMDKA